MLVTAWFTLKYLYQHFQASVGMCKVEVIFFWPVDVLVLQYCKLLKGRAEGKSSLALCLRLPSADGGHWELSCQNSLLQVHSN